MRESVLEGISFCLALGLSVCADGLAERPGGLVVLLVGVLLSGVPLLLIRLVGTGRRRKRAGQTRKAGQIGQRWPISGKKKAAEVVGTPQRQVKHRCKSNISRLYFTEAEGDCQIEF